jgi:PTS system nitrogen regulatory IIA component
MTTQLSDLLTADRTACGVQVASKKRALEKLAELLASASPGLLPGEVFDCLLARERLGSTGLGHGVALPHGRLPQVDHAVGAFLRLSGGVDYDAIDREPVDLLFGLLLPDTGADENLKVLASLAERFDDPVLRERLRATERCADLCELIIAAPGGG